MSMFTMILFSFLINSPYWVRRPKPLAFSELLIHLTLTAIIYTIVMFLLGSNVETVALQLPCMVAGDLISYVVFVVILPSYKTSETN